MILINIDIPFMMNIPFMMRFRSFQIFQRWLLINTQKSIGFASSEFENCLCVVNNVQSTARIHCKYNIEVFSPLSFFSQQPIWAWVTLVTIHLTPSIWRIHKNMWHITTSPSSRCIYGGIVRLFVRDNDLSKVPREQIFAHDVQLNLIDTLSPKCCRSPDIYAWTKRWNE